MSVKLRRKLRVGMVVWVEGDCYLSAKGWMPARCYRAAVANLSSPNLRGERGITLVEDNGMHHWTWTDRVKIVHITATEGAA